MEKVRVLRPILKRRDRNPLFLGNRHLQREPSPIAENGEKVIRFKPYLAQRIKQKRQESMERARQHRLASTYEKLDLSNMRPAYKRGRKNGEPNKPKSA